MYANTYINNVWGGSSSPKPELVLVGALKCKSSFTVLVIQSYGLGREFLTMWLLPLPMRLYLLVAVKVYQDVT